MPLFDDADFLNRLIKLLATDSDTLTKCGLLLSPNDFKPLVGTKWGRTRSIFAACALAHFKKYSEPAGKLLFSEAIAHAQKLNFGEKQIAEIKEFWKHQHALNVTSPDAIIDMVLSYKQERLIASAIQEVTNLHSSGLLTQEKWNEITRKPYELTTNHQGLIDHFSEAETKQRILRRQTAGSQYIRFPYVFIDPLDSLVRMIGRKEMGLILAPYKRGKSLFLLWIAVAYVIQHLNVILITLEDPKNEVEDRLDAIIANVPIKKLADFPRRITNTTNRYRQSFGAEIRVKDGTDGLTVDAIEQIYLQERAAGFIADAIIVDYDDEIVPSEKQKDRRFELADIYRALRRFGARHNLFLWTAAQTQRGTEELKIITGSKTAEDISKIRKVTIAIGVGKGDWGDNSLYLNIAAHKFDKGEIGTNICSNMARQLIYDREATIQAIAENAD